ncbi:MAG: efflux RND transporter periplasmic adaptor subunit [Candidatus Binatia bacterium]
MRHMVGERIGFVAAVALAAGILAIRGSARGEESPTAQESALPEAAGFSRAPIRLTPGQRQAIGVTFGRAERRTIEKKVRTVGRLEYDERRLAEVTLKIQGWIHDLHVDFTGQAVRKGDPLFTIYSPDLVTAQEEYLLALRTHDRLKESRVPGAADSAASLVRASRERLRLWDLTDRQIRALAETGKPKLYQTIHSPISGVVVEKTALKGHAVEPGMTLYRVADLSTIWVYADVYEYDVPLVRVGQEGRLTLPYDPGAVFDAKVTYVYPEVDMRTRTVKVRFELENDENAALKPGMYANVELAIPLGERLVVPRSAILDAGRRQVVFVDGGDGEIAPRDVRAGIRVENDVEILEGLAAGERVVTSGNFLIDSESKLAAAESMMGMMGAIGMGDWKMESARPMDMGGGESPPPEPTAPGPRAAPEPKEKRLGDLLVAVFPAQATANVGEGAIRVRVRDAAGKPATGAEVRFTYTMDMPGMTIEESKAHAVGEGLYEGRVNFTMGGPWGIVVEVRAPGKAPARGKFTVRVAG